jgi:glutamyl-tRNA reductase
MLSFGVIGVSIRAGNVDLLEALAVPQDFRAARLLKLKEACGLSELISVQTCNRAEFYVVTAPGVAVIEARNRLLDFFLKKNAKVPFEPSDLYCHGAFRALRHLYRVAASLDSMMVGEAQVLGQVKEALHWAQEEGLAGSRLATIFAEAFRVAKKVRRETEMGRHAVSMINLLHSAVSEHIEGVAAPTVALVGVGPMTVKLAGHLRDKVADAKLIIVNRTVAKAKKLAEQFGATALALESFLENPPAIDVLFTATSAEEPVVDPVAATRLLAARGKSDSSLVMIDFAMPRDIDPAVGEMPGVRYIDIPFFRGIADANRRERFKAVDAAERIIDESIGRAHRNHAQQQFRPIIASTLNEGLAYAQAGLGRLFGTKLAHLDARDQELIDHWVKKLVHYTNQLPLTALAEHTNTARGDCAFLAGYGCIRTRSETRIDVDPPVANRCSQADGGPCRADAQTHGQRGHPHGIPQGQPHGHPDV